MLAELAVYVSLVIASEELLALSVSMGKMSLFLSHLGFYIYNFFKDKIEMFNVISSQVSELKLSVFLF